MNESVTCLVSSSSTRVVCGDDSLPVGIVPSEHDPESLSDSTPRP